MCAFALPWYPLLPSLSFFQILSQQKQLETPSKYGDTGLDSDEMDTKVVNEDSPGTDLILEETVNALHQVCLLEASSWSHIHF